MHSNEINKLCNKIIINMRSYAKEKSWVDDIYGNGNGPKPMEISVFSKSLQDAGFFVEIKRSDYEKLLSEYFSELGRFFDGLPEIGWSRESRIDGVFDSHEPIFVEAKVSKIDKIHGRRGGASLWDIGQWSKDIVRLQEVRNYIPEAKCFYAILLISKNNLDEDVFGQFKHKLVSDFQNDIENENSELWNGDQVQRKPQRDALWKLLRLREKDVRIEKKGRNWALMLIDVAKLT